MSARHPFVGIAIGSALVISVVVANWLTSRYGFVPVGFGQAATAGTFAAGFALAFRDGVQDALGKAAMLGFLVIAALASYVVADSRIATASAVAFLVSELVDFAVYTPLRRRSLFGDKRWAVAVVSSGLVGAIVDTALFIGIAFGAAAIVPAMVGQLIGKTWATLIYLIIGKAVAVAVLRESNWRRAGA